MQNTRKKRVDTSTTISKGGRADKHAQENHVKKHQNTLLADSKTAPEEINPYKIVEKYKLKGFEFGNWLSNDERYDNLIATNESLVFLAWLFKSQNLGFNCMVGIAFGARGKGKALAHYEPGLNMINLTKMKGAGTLAHEYGHAIDYNFGRYIDQHTKYSALSGGSVPGRRPLIDNVNSSLRAMVNEIVDYPFAIGRKWCDYWGERTEVFARMFEEYIAHQLNKINQKNHYLARPLKYYYSDSVYLTADEFKPLIPKFNALVKLMGTILNSKGKVPMPLVPYPLPKAAAKTTRELLPKSAIQFYEKIKSTPKYKDHIILFFQDERYIAIGEDAKKIADMMNVKLYKGTKYGYVKFNKTLYNLLRYRGRPSFTVDVNKISSHTATQGTLFSRSQNQKKL